MNYNNVAGTAVYQPKKVQSTIGQMSGPPLIILDVQNIAMRYGHNQKFVCQGIKIALEYW